MEDIRILTVAADDGSSRLDVFLSRGAPDLSRARIQSLIEQGLVLVDGLPGKAAKKTKVGQTVVLTVPPSRPSRVTPDPAVEFEILHQDHDLIVINKPAGLVVHPAAGNWEGTLVQGLLAACPDLEGVGGETRPGIVHRLDKDTSGVMVAAKTQRAHQALVEFFKTGEIRKSYLALSVGWPRNETGLIDLPIGRHPVRRKEMSTRSTAGRPARTRYEILRRFSLGVGLLRLQLLTGRTHQIRVHLATVGCPVLGDQVYGRGNGVLKGRGAVLEGLARRQMLHSHRLEFRHPVSGLPLNFEAALPPDLAGVLQLLESMDV
ncbi:MAG: RluA family pseudouridine synthase [Pseudomonadota bacterium]